MSTAVKKYKFFFKSVCGLTQTSSKKRVERCGVACWQPNDQTRRGGHRGAQLSLATWRTSARRLPGTANPGGGEDWISLSAPSPPGGAGGAPASPGTGAQQARLTVLLGIALGPRGARSGVPPGSQPCAHAQHPPCAHLPCLLGWPSCRCLVQ